MDTIEKDQIFYYLSKDTFKSEIDDVHAFPRPNFECGMHMQEFFEINIITRGSGRHYIEDNCIETRVGDVFIIPPKVKHGFKGGGLDVFHVLISDRFMNKNMSDLQLIPSFYTLFAAEPLMRGKGNNVLYLRLEKAQFDELNEILKIALACRNQLDAFDCLSRKGFVLLLISFLCRIYSRNSDSAVNRGENTDEAFLNAISYIHEHYFEKISVDTLAKIANLSRSTFLRKFNEVCKIPPSEYIINRRLEVAEYMLLNTGDSILNIAFKCGFYDAAHFSRLFLKSKGITPSQYRNSAKSK